MINGLKQLIDTTPRQCARYLRELISDRIVSPVGSPGSPAILTRRYFARQAEQIAISISRLRAGESLEAAIQGFPGREFGERVVEYPSFANWLLSGPAGLDILDIGCVLNNAAVVGLVQSHCDRLWLLNPAAESLNLFTSRLFYHLSPLESAFSHGETFPLVTCISTIEHIGYDNSHYGVAEPAKYTEPSDEPLRTSLEKISALLSPGGRCFITVPFGQRELVKHPKTGKFSSQVFDAPAIRQGLAIFRAAGVESTYRVYAAAAGGWESVDPDKFDGRYAHGTPSASAVAIIDGIKHDFSPAGGHVYVAT